MEPALTPNDLTNQAGVGRWVLDPGSSSVRISSKTMWGLVPVKGVFGTLKGQGAIEPGGKVTGTLVIDAASIDTKNTKRDTHLRSADFFDVEHYPDVTVEVTSATVRDSQVDLQANLGIRGVEVPLTFSGEATAVSEDSITLTATTKVDRHAFGMSWNKGGMMKGLTTVTVIAAFRRANS
jgi:polyisoprenoid-binding protein YceI